MAKKNLEKKTSSKKSEGVSKKSKKLSSRKALAKFANSELQPEKNLKSALVIKKKRSKRFDTKDQHEISAVKAANNRIKPQNIDASSRHNRPEDILVETSTTNVLVAKKAKSKEISQRFSETSYNLLLNASTLLAIASGIAILFALVMAVLPGGKDAVPAMGGVLEANVPLETAQIVFFLDILFPITFGAGFALFATAFQTHGNRPIIRMILTALLFVVLADFSENALVFKSLTGGQTLAIQWPLTVIKYAMLGISAVLLSFIMVIKGIMGTISMLFLRFVFPISIAVLVAGIGGRIGSDVIGATFPLGLLLLAIYARQQSLIGRQQN